MYLSFILSVSHHAGMMAFIFDAILFPVALNLRENARHCVCFLLNYPLYT